MPATSTILHVAMDAFYASIELRDNPSLAGLPICVGGPSDERGVISAANHDARRFGIEAEMPTAEARRRCPDLVLLPPDFERYTAVSREIMSVFRSYTALVEPVSLDRVYLDVTERVRASDIQSERARASDSQSERARASDRESDRARDGEGESIARAIQQEILRKTALVASIGVAPSKFLAKLAAELESPDRLRVIRAEDVREILDPLPVSRIVGLAARSALRLESMGVLTVGELASRARADVVREFGATGGWIHDLAHGIDSRRVTARREEKSHGMERTFTADVVERDEIRRALLSFCDEVSYGLRDKGLRGRTVTLKLRYADGRAVTRTRTLDFPTNLAPRLFNVARELFDRTHVAPVRLLGVQVSNLEDVRQPVQESLFGDADPAARSRGAKRAALRLPHDTTRIEVLREKLSRSAGASANLIARARVSKRDPSARK